MVKKRDNGYFNPDTTDTFEREDIFEYPKSYYDSIKFALDSGLIGTEAIGFLFENDLLDIDYNDLEFP